MSTRYKCVKLWGNIMKKLLLSMLFIAGFASGAGQSFTAGNYYETPDFWDLTLTPIGDNQYQAVLYDYTYEYKGILDREDIGNTTIYRGKDEDGEAFIVTALERDCTADGKSGIWSHSVVIAESKDRRDYKGCGGKWLGDEKDGNNYSVPQQAQKKAKKLNTRGYHLYKKKDYAEAVRLFYRATETDSNYALAQYNLACTIMLALDNCEIEGDETYTEIVDSDTAFKALKKAIKLDPKRLERSQTDPDLAEIRQSYRFYHDILGYRTNDDEQLRLMLQNIGWESVGIRLLHVEPFSRLLFHPDGRVQIKKTHEITENIPENSLPWRYTYKDGQYRVKDGIITLDFDGKTVEGKLSEHGTLHFDDKKGILPSRLYRFARDYCSA